MAFAIPWTEMELIMLSEISQMKSHGFPHVKSETVESQKLRVERWWLQEAGGDKEKSRLQWCHISSWYSRGWNRIAQSSLSAWGLSWATLQYEILSLSVCLSLPKACTTTTRLLLFIGSLRCCHEASTLRTSSNPILVPRSPFSKWH